MAKQLDRRSVIIVGGGLTAGLVARRLTASGVDVLVLERGGDHTAGAESRLPNQRDELRWSVHQGLMQDWSKETYTLRHAPAEEALPVRWMEAFLPGQGMGGAANHWNGMSWRWSEYEPVLRTRLRDRYGAAAIPADMPIQDWGVTYAELEPYHDLFERLFGICGKAGNINGHIQPGGNPFEAPRRNEYPQPPLEMTEAGLIFQQTAASMGYHPFPLPAANSSRAYTNPDGQRLGQCQYCGHCDRFICEAQAKASPQVLLYPMLRQRQGFEIRLGCQVLALLYDRAAQRVRGVRYLDLLTGEEYEQPADVVVLAAFTMTNTRLLLLERIGQPYDPVNARGVVGKNFCYQAGAGISVFFKDRWINPFMSSGSTATIIDEFNNDNFDHAGLGFLGGGYISGGVLSGRPIGHHPVPPGTPRWGTRWKQACADWYAHAFEIGAEASCYPNRHNYLDLDPVYRDAYDRPLLRMTFDWPDNELRMCDYLSKQVTALARTSGASLLGRPDSTQRPFDVRFYQTTHVTGGTIMGADPGTSVVSPHLQHWDAHNLFVVGASLYPHNSSFNPTGPLAALALRLGDDLVRYVHKPALLT
jgi:gluconate 2-dehydrogenase alpha chain